MKASSTDARLHGPADLGSIGAVSATTLRLRSALAAQRAELPRPHVSPPRRQV